MHNFLRLKSLRIPVLPGAEVSAAQKPYPETVGRKRKRKSHMLKFRKSGSQYVHLHGMTFPPEVRTHWFCFDGTP
jgi:hypothetical protein